jgi:predicted nucleic acid-binding protein
VRAILDTSVIIADGVPRLDGELAISVVTLAELHYGVMVADGVERRAQRLRKFVLAQKLFDALPVDDAVAASYGRLAAEVRRVGRQPRTRAFDLLIAATAHAHSARLYTRNATDLKGINDLVDVVPV